MDEEVFLSVWFDAARFEICVSWWALEVRTSGEGGIHQHMEGLPKLVVGLGTVVEIDSIGCFFCSGCLLCFFFSMFFWCFFWS